MRAEQPSRVDASQQMLHGQQRMNFRGVEPEARQFILITDLFVLGVKAVGPLIPVPNDGGIETVAHVLQVTFQCGRRYR